MQKKDGQPVRVKMKATGADHGEEYRQEAFVDYDSSDFGAVVPLNVEHREWQGTKNIVENQFTYEGWRRIGR